MSLGFYENAILVLWSRLHTATHIVVVGLVHAGTFVAGVTAEFLEAVRKVVEKVREIWEELKKFLK